MGFYNGKKYLDLEVVMTYIRPTRNTDRNQIKSRKLYKRKSPPFETFNKFNKIVHTTKVHICGLRKYFKVYIAESVTLIGVSPNNNNVLFAQNPFHPVHSLL